MDEDAPAAAAATEEAAIAETVAVAVLKLPTLEAGVSDGDAFTE